jgi:acetyl esterase/lipase
MKMTFIAAFFAVGLSAFGVAVPATQWTYKTVDGKELKMDVFLPENYQAEEQFPVFMFLHGGSWREGTPSMQYPDCDYMSKRGMIAVAVDYRLKDRDNVEVPLECVKDAKFAIRFLRQNAKELKVDAGRIVAAGDSAGGQLAAALAMITDPKTNDEGYDLSISCRPDALILHNPYFKCQAELSPPNFVTNGLPPVIMFLGDQDQAISVESLLAFHEALKGAGNASEFYVGKGGKHGFCNGRNPKNPFFYWSLELQDQFLVKHGILSGESRVKIPDGVKALQTDDFCVYP